MFVTSLTSNRLVPDSAADTLQTHFHPPLPRAVHKTLDCEAIENQTQACTVQQDSQPKKSQ